MAPTASSEEEAVPSPGDPDRKRVLNVLAQRRYRQRRRQRIAELEAKAKASDSSVGASTSSDTSPRDKDSPPDAGGVPITDDSSSSSAFAMPMQLGNDSYDNAFGPLPAAFGDAAFMSQSLSWPDTGLEEMEDYSRPTEASFDPCAANLGSLGQIALLGSTNTNTGLLPDLSLIQNPDIPLIKVMTISLAIAQLLGCGTSLWDDNYRWTLDPLSCAHIPSAFQPTAIQMSVPHHPLFDLVPFKTTRNKLILAFAMPEALRPPHAKGNMAMMGVVHDMEDDTEGFRVNGADGYREEDWEVGEAFAKHWWWALDRETIRRTNEMRVGRGQRRLLEAPD